MRFWKSNFLKCHLLVMVVSMLCCLPLVGCGGGGAPQEKAPEEIEESRQEHIKIHEMEAAGG